MPRTAIASAMASRMTAGSFGSGSRGGAGGFALGRSAPFPVAMSQSTPRTMSADLPLAQARWRRWSRMPGVTRPRLLGDELVDLGDARALGGDGGGGGRGGRHFGSLGGVWNALRRHPLQDAGAGSRAAVCGP